jgi:DNA modification methylase
MQVVSITNIKPNPSNPRLIKDDKFKKLVQSLKDFPEMANVRPIVVNQDMVILGGNMRFKAMKEAKWKEIPVEVVDWDEAKQREFIIKDNVGFGEWDWDDLANNWDAEELDKWGLDVPQFEAEQLEAEEDNYEMPDEVQTDIVLGDLFEIGDHRLLCGDSTDSDQVAKLMNGENADMVFTDPPYGIKVVQGNKVGGDKGFGSVGGVKIVKSKIYSEIIGDDTTDTAREFYNTCVSLGMENFIIWGGNYFTDFLSPSMCWIIWDKENTGNFADVEMAWTSFEKGAKLYKWQWNGMIRKGHKNIEGKTRVHPTQKPVGLFGDIFNDFKFIICFDGFLGSGSTMVAAHQLKRKCYGMELDTKYCQVIIDRMLKLDPTLQIKRNGQPYLTEGTLQPNYTDAQSAEC